MAVPYRNQDYYKLKEEYRERRKKFTDQEFPPDEISLGISSANITWKRPQVIIIMQPSEIIFALLVVHNYNIYV